MARPLLAGLAVSSLLMIGAAGSFVGSAVATTRPHYGGSLHIEMAARVGSLDPREWPSDAGEAAAKEKLLSLVFERLVRLDDQGRVQPQLALGWQQNAEGTSWEFALRPGARFHDGSAVTPVAVARALQPLVSAGNLLVTPANDLLRIEAKQPLPDLLGRLAAGPYFVSATARDGRGLAPMESRLAPTTASMSGLVGTGPFRMMSWQPQQRLIAVAFEEHWGGRPFLDRIEVILGTPPHERLVNLELDKADLVELTPEQVRRASQGSTRVWASAPVELLAVTFDARRLMEEDSRLRRALALSIDRAAIHNVLLQKQGVIAGGLLPQWISGYAFLFSTARDLDQARNLVAELSPQPLILKLAYDSADSLAGAVAARIAVNARETGMTIQVVPENVRGTAVADLWLKRIRIKPESPVAALSNLLEPLGLENLDVMLLPPKSIEDLYARERSLIEQSHILWLRRHAPAHAP